MLARATNWVYIVGPANGTLDHTIDPSDGTNAVAGTPFTPTTGRAIAVVAGGPVTSTTPTALTSPTGGTAVQDSGLYLWYDESAAGGDTWVSTHNAPNHRNGFLVIEYPAGTTFVKSVAATGQSTTAANPNLTGLTGTNQVIAVAVMGDDASGGTTGSATWSGATGFLDSDTDYDAGNGNVGFWLGGAASDDYTGSSFAPTPTITAPGTGNSERLTFAFNVPAGDEDPPVNTVAPEVTGTPTEGETLTCDTGTWDNSPTGFSYQWQRLA